MLYQGRYFFGSSGFDAKLNDELSKIMVMPAAGGYLRKYGLLPSQITATGPKGHVLKGDVLRYA